MSKLYACIISETVKRDKALLVSVADKLASGIELLKDGILFDVSGLENLIGDADRITEEIARQLKANRISGKIAVDKNINVAILLARGGDSTANAADPFSQLSLRELEIDPDTLNIFKDLGLHTVQDLRQIPPDKLIDRYGHNFRNVIDIIERKDGRLLAPNVKETSVNWSYDLDFPVEDFEQLIFIVNHGLERLFAQVAHFGLSTEQLDISFGLRKKKKKSYEIKTSFPTLERSFWLKLVNLRISLDAPESAIERVSVVAHFTKPRPDQRGLYSVSRPEPESLMLTVNKIKKLVGENNVGVAVLLDQRLPEAFSLNADQFPQGREKFELRPENLIAAFNYFRPPVSAAVTVENKRLLFIKTARFSDGVRRYSGAWKENSYWWNNPWCKKEWDIETENNGVFRLEKNGAEWFLTGEYD